MTDYSNDLVSAEGVREATRKQIKATGGDHKSILGSTADAALMSLDHLAMDILAINQGGNSAYKTARITLYEQLHGAGKWAAAVSDATWWFEGRKADRIKSPVDVKGPAALQSIAQRATAVTEVLAEAQSAS